MNLIQLLKFIRRPQPESVHPLIQDNNDFFFGMNSNRPLVEYDFVVFDTELTGLNRRQDEIIAIGGVRIKNFQISCQDTFLALVKPTDKFHSSSTLIHRITPQELIRADSLTDVLPQFIEFCRHAVLVGHYVSLDVAFVNQASRKILGGPLQNPYIDTMHLAMTLNELTHGPYYNHHTAAQSYTLQALSKEHKLPKFKAHDALQDSLQTAYLFLYLTKKMPKAEQLTLKDLLKAG